METLIVTFFVFCFSAALLSYGVRRLGASKSADQVSPLKTNPFFLENEFRDVTIVVTLSEDPQETLRMVTDADYRRTADKAD